MSAIECGICVILASFALLMIIVILKSCIWTDEEPARKEDLSAPKGGYKNYKGDTWYPDGRIWRKDKQKWEKPDYNNSNEKQHTD